jgi:hypothetical protein
MSTTFRLEGDYRCKQIRCLKPIYKEWIKILTEFAEQWKRDRDVPWWYNERASLSLFAGAIWRAGGHCLEEYSDQKRAIGRRTKRIGNFYIGRVDLFFTWHGIDFIAEAKQTWSGFTRGNENALNRLKSHLKDARKDIHGPLPNRQRRLAILFARPYFQKGVSAEEINMRLQTWIANLADLDTTSYAWAFPRCARHMRTKWSYCPGEAILIKQVWR